MTKMRFTQIGVLLSLLAWYVACALPAAAMPAPSDPAEGTADHAATLPAHPIIVHQQTPAWTYVVIVAGTLAATLAVVLLVARLRHASAGKPRNLSTTAA